MIHLILKTFPPNIPPKLVGQHWVDKVSRRIWFSIGTVLVTDWIETGTVEALSLSNSPFVIRANVASARTVDPATIIKPAILSTEGGETPGDGLGKVFRWVETSLAVDDGSAFTTNIKPDVRDVLATGRWEQTSLG